jgi:hypothetical protein
LANILPIVNHTPSCFKLVNQHVYWRLALVLFLHSNITQNSHLTVKTLAAW